MVGSKGGVLQNNKTQKTFRSCIFISSHFRSCFGGWNGGLVSGANRDYIKPGNTPTGKTTTNREILMKNSSTYFRMHFYIYFCFSSITHDLYDNKIIK